MQLIQLAHIMVKTITLQLHAMNHISEIDWMNYEDIATKVMEIMRHFVS